MALTQPQINRFVGLLKDEQYRINREVSKHFDCSDEALYPEEVKQALKLLRGWQQPRLDAAKSITNALEKKVDEIENRLILTDEPASSIDLEPFFDELAEVVPSSVPVAHRRSSPEADGNDEDGGGYYKNPF
jgi:hypothetical protein